ncbi:hypothetical protein HUG15_21075 [Salicibibacter cibarius]|uniref:Uncharacterized protein n=1 Tax=Salicibibacter cibarius TaxID=2743000 RepID=A0A7T7CDC0_9BACI|nr:hypothetical protein [Salicibibacter cibarius]QQK77823.1 hypothetical protein HUG15_21075 [Salicibibacter cibarius]
MTDGSTNINIFLIGLYFIHLPIGHDWSCVVDEKLDETSSRETSVSTSDSERHSFDRSHGRPSN